MTNQHPITPPLELVQEWREEWAHKKMCCEMDDYLAIKAAQWGADMELEGCIDVLGGQWEWDALGQCTGWKEFRNLSEKILRAARRPQPPSLKEQALAALREAYEMANDRPPEGISNDQIDTIRTALETLDD
jgi:hypothetical protein